MVYHAYENMHGVVEVVLCPCIKDTGKVRISCRDKKLSVTASNCISILYSTGCDQISMYHIVRL